MAFRLVQVSDAHLSASRPVFRANFDAASEALRGLRPDLVVDTGDVSLDGADSEDDLRAAREARVAAWSPFDFAAVPGNHDTGDDPGPGARQPADAARLARWTRVFGPDRFARDDAPGWRLIGLDSQVVASGLDDAEHQWDFLEAALRGAAEAGRAVGLFLHKPLWLEGGPEEPDAGYWTVKPGPRRRLLGLLAARPPAFVASGHLHQWRDRPRGPAGWREVWAPSVAFIVGDAHQPAWGEKALGLVEHLLHPDGTHEARPVPVPGAERLDVGAMPEVYGPLTRLAA